MRRIEEMGRCVVGYQSVLADDENALSTIDLS